MIVDTIIPTPNVARRVRTSIGPSPFSELVLSSFMSFVNELGVVPMDMRHAMMQHAPSLLHTVEAARGDVTFCGVPVKRINQTIDGV